MGKKCFISNLLIKNAERRENEVKARVKKTDAARISQELGNKLSWVGGGVAIYPLTSD